jgi:hypothetical protein
MYDYLEPRNLYGIFTWNMKNGSGGKFTITSHGKSFTGHKQPFIVQENISNNYYSGLFSREQCIKAMLGIK